MLQKPTDEMEEALKEVRPGQIDSYLKTNSQYMVDETRAFYFYMKDVLKRKGILHKDLYVRMNVSEKYGGQILTMEKHTPNRDLIMIIITRIMICGRRYLMNLRKHIYSKIMHWMWQI